MLIRSVLALFLFGSVSSAHAENWQPLTGTNLRALVNDTVIEGGLAGKAKLIGQYCADGSGRIKAWGEHFPRSWEIEGGSTLHPGHGSDRLFFNREGRGRGQPVQVVDPATGEVWLFSVLDRKADFCQQPTVHRKRRLVRLPTAARSGPTAEEIANKLANPTSAMSSLGNSLDYTKYKGNLPGAERPERLELPVPGRLSLPPGKRRQYSVSAGDPGGHRSARADRNRIRQRGRGTGRYWIRPGLRQDLRKRADYTSGPGWNHPHRHG